MNIDSQKIIEYVDEKVKEKHKTCLTDMFDNGYFWAMKELQSYITQHCVIKENSTDD